MNAIICSGYFFILYLSNLQLVAVADDGSYVPTENIVLSCGSNTSEFVQYDGRNWNGDIVSPYVPFDADTKSLAVRAPNTLEYIPEVPYMTARIFYSKFIYTFNVTPGPKFIRLHFYPASYINLNISNAFLSVSAANLTLLHNFSASLNADYYNLAYFMKEFIVHVSGSVLQLTFSPSYNASHAFAFVNGIEVVSMPLNLYTTGGDGVPPTLVGHKKFVKIYNDTAMENLYRLNVGGEKIPPKYDTGMFRSWDVDEDYILGANVDIRNFNMSMLVLYSDNAPPYSAPVDVYRTSRSMSPFDDGLINLNYNMTWFFPVDSGFLYLVRLHFCEIYQGIITKVNQVVFTIFLNNQTAEEQFDVIAWGGEPGVAVHRDYVVMVPHVNEGKQDLWLDLHPYKDSKPMYYNAYLNGVEIFKLSNFGDKSLAGLNPPKNIVKVPHVAHFNKSSKKLKFFLIGCGLLAVVVLPLLLCLLLIRLKVIKLRRVVSLCGLTVHTPNRIEKAKKWSLCTQFSMREIKLATNDFHEDLLIGTGGFGSVYKGSFTGGATYVAVKRANPMSEQGISEFEAEILLLSQLRHHNLVSLLGYCNEDGEMILVYDFMANGNPECYESNKLTEKSDIYSLGVVLLEVLTARPAVSVGEDDEHINLAEWTVSCLENGNVEEIVDPNLKENIIKDCFELYLGVAMKCLAERGVERPSIGEVLESLVLAMHLQKNGNHNAALQGNSDLTPGVEFSEIMTPIGIKSTTRNHLYCATTAASSELFSELSRKQQANCFVQMAYGKCYISSSFNGEIWVGDSVSSFLPPEYGNSSSTLLLSNMKDSLVPKVPYSTARITHSPLTYSFPSSPGLKFIRLYFLSSLYLMTIPSAKAYFSVKAGPYTLVSHFNPSDFAEELNSKFFTKDFLLNVREDKLTITLTPSPLISKAFAFVNGIEILPVPKTIYFPGSKVPVPYLGHQQILLTNDEYALETLYRVGICGGENAFGMWSDDSRYISRPHVGGVLNIKNLAVSLNYTTLSSKDYNYSAPEEIYWTARTMGSDGDINMKNNLTWSFPVDSGFKYLVRLHFCEISIGVTQPNQRVFKVYINNQTAEERMDVVDSAGAPFTPLHKDYVVMVPTESGRRKDLWISLQPNLESKPKYADAILNGIEIMKISDSNHSLAAMFRLRSEQRNKKVQHVIIVVAATLGTIFGLVFTFFINIHRAGKKLKWRTSHILPSNSSSNHKNIQPTVTSGLCHQFTLEEISIATSNFSEDLVIGEGGFGKVYKGIMHHDGVTAVAVKRSNRRSGQGYKEFQTEINFFSFCHMNLVSLLGYCQEGNELILVYEYMAEGNVRPECLRAFVDLGIHCLADRTADRPTMGEVLNTLERILYLQDSLEEQERHTISTSSL
ncbi:hypothetical protein V8G54_017490 [Vigna mungo]|uniref:Protein kinase domain-containing protein n=1 Tax=Vigna mungo TaxID=3915 RepID=A0AAQ3NM15_VIGMU